MKNLKLILTLSALSLAIAACDRGSQQPGQDTGRSGTTDQGGQTQEGY